MTAQGQLVYLAFVVIGLVAGVGMLFVRPAPGEPERVAVLFPLARYYRHTAVRVVVSLACFAFAFIGLALLFGWA